MGNIVVGGQSVAVHIANYLNPLGVAVGLDGVIMLAYIIAIPAIEIVVPTMAMTYVGMGLMAGPDTFADFRGLLVGQRGWTMLTAVNLMLFSLLQNPCATTILTTWKETRNLKWTTFGALMPLAIGFGVTFVVAQAARLLGRVSPFSPLVVAVGERKATKAAPGLWRGPVVFQAS